MFVFYDHFEKMRFFSNCDKNNLQRKKYHVKHVSGCSLGHSWGAAITAVHLLGFICVVLRRDSPFCFPTGHCASTFCLSELHHAKPLLQVQSYGVCLFCGWLISLSKMSSSCMHAVVRVQPPFLVKAASYCTVCVHPVLLLCSSPGGHLGSCHLLDIAN